MGDAEFVKKLDFYLNELIAKHAGIDPEEVTNEYIQEHIRELRGKRYPATDES